MNPDKERTRGRFWNQNILFFEIEEMRFLCKLMCVCLRVRACVSVCVLYVYVYMCVAVFVSARM